VDEQTRAIVPSVAVGVDGSDTALRAVRWAAAEAHRRRAPLRILHAAPYALDNVPGERRAAAILTRAHTVADHAQPQVSTHTEWRTEHLVRVLTAAAETAQLLVVGMAGGTRFDDVLVQSTALDVSAAATCPVVVVRGRPRPAPARGPVVVGVEDVGHDAAALTAAFDDAGRTGTRLVVLHTLHGPESVLDAVAGHSASGRAAAEQMLTQALSPWRSRHPGVPVDVQVMHGSAAGHLLEAAVSARLVVVGTHARGPGGRMIHGSTSRAVTRRCPCPVMTVRPDVRIVEPAPVDQVPGTPPTTVGTPAPPPWSLPRRDHSELW
jgi:nucleotide-binding universal stress UspA family protein